jgi:hypothetical protein
VREGEADAQGGEVSAPLTSYQDGRPGIYSGVPMADYLALPYLSSGLCHRILTTSPYHARYEQENRERDDTDASDMGTAIHDALLEGIDRIQAIDAPDWRTKAAKDARELARAAGKIPMLAHKVAQVQAAVSAAKDCIAASELAGVFDDGQPELTLVWDEGGITAKARPDWTAKGWHVSVKTTEGSANPAIYTRHRMSALGHDTGLAFYARAFLALGIHVEHRILLIEQSPPYGACIFGLAPSKWEYAERRIARAIATWQQCHETGHFPCYPTRTVFAEALPWEMAQEEEADLNAQYDEQQAEHGLQI